MADVRSLIQGIDETLMELGESFSHDEVEAAMRHFDSIIVEDDAAPVEVVVHGLEVEYHK